LDHQGDPVALQAVDLLSDLQETFIGELMAQDVREGERSFLLARPDFRSQAEAYLELCGYSRKPASQMASALRALLNLEADPLLKTTGRATPPTG
jgi:hypothetical protein